MLERIHVLVGTASLFFVVAAANAQELVEITSCGQIVPDKAVGYLSADLDCTGFTGGPANAYDAGAAVNLGAKSALDLRGFTLTTGAFGVMCNNLECDGRPCVRRSRCEVFGGTITGNAQRCIGGYDLRVHDVTITGCYYTVYGYQRASIVDSSISGSEHSGVVSGKTVVVGSTLTGNAIFGVQAANTNRARALIQNSTITGNGTESECLTNPQYCADVQSNLRPSVRGTTCDKSQGPGGPWGVCAQD